MKQILAILALSSLLFSCKKDRLKDDKSIFIGKWEWFKSDHTYGYCTGDPPIDETITPDTDGYNYSIEFLEKGIVKFYENGNQLEKDRIVFTLFDGTKCKTFPNFLEFYINLDNDKDDFTKKLNGCIKQDTIIIKIGFPYYDDPNGCEKYTNYFVRE